MSSTTQKHRNFVGEPMGNKGVKQLPGIGSVLGDRYIAKGITQASQLYGQYLAMNRDEVRFRTWQQETVGGNVKQWNDCYQCMRDYSNAHL